MPGCAEADRPRSEAGGTRSACDRLDPWSPPSPRTRRILVRTEQTRVTAGVEAVSNLSLLAALQAERRPDRLALVEPGVRAITWAELNRRVDGVAGGLVGTGLLAGQRIGLDGGNSIAWVVAYLAALRAGLVVVPTDPDESTDERDSLLAACGARAVLTTRGGAADERIPSLELSEEGLAALASTATEVATPPDVEALAVIATTLGTSADPKTVMLSHRALLAHLQQVSGYGIVDADSVVLGVLPFFHAYGLNAVLGSCLAAGARLVLPDPATWDLLTVIEAEQVDNLPITPGLLYRLVHEEDAADRLAGSADGHGRWRAAALAPRPAVHRADRSAGGARLRADRGVAGGDDHGRWRDPRSLPRGPSAARGRRPGG